MLSLPLLAAVAMAQTGAPERSGARAEAVARATIVSPARLIIEPGARSARIDETSPSLAKPRKTRRPCDATATSQSCLTIVFDLP